MSVAVAYTVWCDSPECLGSEDVMVVNSWDRSLDQWAARVRASLEDVAVEPAWRCDDSGDWCPEHARVSS